MKKTLLSILSLIHVAIFTYGQEEILKITSQRKDDKSVDFLCNKTAPGNYTVVFNFLELTNTPSPSRIFNIEGSGGPVLTLKPTDRNNDIGYRYTYTYIKGKLKPKLNNDFCYLIPYSPGTTCQAYEASYINEQYFGAEKPADWKSYFFYTDKEDTVTAIRKGIVVEVTDKFESRDENTVYTSSLNSIIIEHKDGTFSRYQGFKKGTIKVNVGDIVLPGSPLGMNVSFPPKRFGISILIYYLKSVDFESLQGQSLSKPKSLYGIVAPKFSVDNNAGTTLENGKKYQSFSNDEIIKKEMSRKELKRITN